MNSPTKILFIALFSILISVGFSYEINGTLSDCHGPVTGITMMLSAPNGSVIQSDANGFWKFGVSGDEYNIANGTWGMTSWNGQYWQMNRTLVTIAGDTPDVMLYIQKNYCEQYVATDIPKQTVDVIGGTMGAFAEAANPLIWVIVAGIIIGSVVLIIKHIKDNQLLID